MTRNGKIRLFHFRIPFIFANEDTLCSQQQQQQNPRSARVRVSRIRARVEEGRTTNNERRREEDGIGALRSRKVNRTARTRFQARLLISGLPNDLFPHMSSCDYGAGCSYFSMQRGYRSSLPRLSVIPEEETRRLLSFDRFSDGVTAGPALPAGSCRSLRDFSDAAAGASALGAK